MLGHRLNNLTPNMLEVGHPKRSSSCSGGTWGEGCFLPTGKGSGKKPAVPLPQRIIEFCVKITRFGAFLVLFWVT